MHISMFQHSDPTTPPSYSFDGNSSGTACSLPFYGYKTTPVYFGAGGNTAGVGEQMDSTVIKRSLTPPSLRRPIQLSSPSSRGHSPPRHPIYARLRREEALLHTEGSEAMFTQRVADEDMLCRLLSFSLSSPSDSNPLGEAISNRRSYLRSTSFGVSRSAPQRKAPSVAIHSSPVAPRLPKPSAAHASSSHGLSAVQSPQQTNSGSNATMPIIITPLATSALHAESPTEMGSTRIRTPRYSMGPSTSASMATSAAAFVAALQMSSSDSGIDSSTSNADSNSVPYQFAVGVPPRSSSAPPIPLDDMA